MDFRAEANDADVWRASPLRPWPLPRGCDAGSHEMPLAWRSGHRAEEWGRDAAIDHGDGRRPSGRWLERIQRAKTLGLIDKIPTGRRRPKVKAGPSEAIVRARGIAFREIEVRAQQPPMRRPEEMSLPELLGDTRAGGFACSAGDPRSARGRQPGFLRISDENCPRSAEFAHPIGDRFRKTGRSLESQWQILRQPAHQAPVSPNEALARSNVGWSCGARSQDGKGKEPPSVGLYTIAVIGRFRAVRSVTCVALMGNTRNFNASGAVAPAKTHRWLAMARWVAALSVPVFDASNPRRVRVRGYLGDT